MMRKRRRWLWWALGVGLVLATCVATMLWSTPKNDYEELIPELKGAEVKQDNSYYVGPFATSPGIRFDPKVMREANYLVHKPFREVETSLRGKGSTFHLTPILTSIKTKRTNRFFRVDGHNDRILLSIFDAGPDETSVTIVETRDANWLDRARQWFHWNFGGKANVRTGPVGSSVDVE